METHMSNGHRVVVTGLGSICPVGMDTKTTWESMLSGKNGIGPITRFDAEGFDATFAAEVPDFDPTKWISAKEARRMDRYVQFAVAASVLCVEDAGLDLEKLVPERFGVIIGSGIGGMETLEAQHQTLLEKGPGRVRVAAARRGGRDSSGALVHGDSGHTEAGQSDDHQRAAGSVQDEPVEPGRSDGLDPSVAGRR